MIKELRIKLAMQELKMPFNVDLNTFPAKNAESQSIFVNVENQHGDIGYGESSPRDYVASDSVPAVSQFYDDFYSDIIHNIRDLTSLQQWTEEHELEIDSSPTAWCAIELALLDLFAKEACVSVETLLGLPPVSGQFYYSAIIDDNTEQQFVNLAHRYIEMGLTDFNVKLSGDQEVDRNKLYLLDQIAGRPIRVRANAHRMWRSVQQATTYIDALKYPLFALEEPLQSQKIRDLNVLGDVLALPIILDESCSRIDQLDLLTNASAERWILNLRISKMGGILRSLAFIQQARELGIPIIIGSQAGETSILTRAACTAAMAAQDILIAQEGAFGTMLLKEDICQPSIMFGYAGRLESSDYQFDTGYGFGLNHVVH